jgi:hypothetical protein
MGPVRDADALAAGVRRAIARRRRARAGVAGMIVLAGVVRLGAIVEQRGEREKVAVTPPAPTAAKSDPAAELAAIRTEIAVREKAVKELLVAERLERAAGRAELLQALPADRAVAERAAAVVVWQADRGVRAGGDRGGAERAYSDVVRYFPDTVSAEVARRRLEELRKDGRT